MEIAFRVSLPLEAASVPMVRRLCRCSFRTLGVEEECVADLELAVTEACTNVLKHAAGTDNTYEVEVRTDESTCDLRVKDKGSGFAPRTTEAGASRPQPVAEGGRGIQLMRELVDRLQFVSHELSGTVVHLEKSLRLSRDPPVGAARGRDSSAPYTG
jgi:serine/threonine-protein kinase RsbW